jgi:hypothetical protein
MKEARTPKSTHGFSHRIPSMLAAAAIIAGGASQAYAQNTATDQIAIWLGATQLGYSSSYTPGANSTNDASALRQGQLALAATAANFNKTAFVVRPGTTNRAVVPDPQTAAFRSQYLAAVQRALTTPTTGSLTRVPVVTQNPTSGRLSTNPISGNLNPASTTPTLILNSVVAKMPNFGPAIVSNAVAATMAGTTGTNGIFTPTWGAAPKPTKANLSSSNNINLFNSRTASTQLSNAGKAASAALTAASKAYTRGTVNWQGWPANGATNPNGYLPNFGVTTLGPRGGTGSQLQAPNLTGLADTASAVAANAINGLGAVNTNNTLSGLYGKSQVNVQFITQQLITAAKAFQATSIRTTVGPYYAVGSLGAASFGLITQVAGYNSTYTNGANVITNGGNQSWGSSGSEDTFTYLLNGVVSGAVKAVGNKNVSQLGAIAQGVAQGFTAAYLQNQYNADPGNIMTMAAFNTINAGQISQAFTAAGVAANVLSQFSPLIGQGINNTYGCFSTNSGTWTFGTNNPLSLTLAGAKGINLGNTNNGITPLINGVGTPVTDTTGL